MHAGRILWVDDDANVLKSVQAVLVSHGFAVSAVGTVPEALELISTQAFDVLLTDLNVGQPGDGFTVVSAMRRVQPVGCGVSRVTPSRRSSSKPASSSRSSAPPSRRSC